MSTVATVSSRGGVASTLRWLAVLLVVISGAATRATAQEPTLPPAPRDIAGSRKGILLTLPDSGGFAINNQPIAVKELESQLKAIFDKRPTKALLVSYQPGSRSADLRMVMAIAHRLGIRLYAAV